MSSSEAREHWRSKRTAIVQSFCAKNGFELKGLNHGFQLRIENVMDVYPTNGKWHWLPTGERGDWHTKEDLRRVMLKHLPAARPAAISKPPYDKVEYRTREGFRTLAQSENIMNVLSVPAPKRLWPALIWARIKRFFHV